MSTGPLAQVPHRRHLQMVRVGAAHPPLRLVHVEHSARRFAPHFFTTHAVGVVESGRCCLMTPRGAWVAAPGSLVAFAPNVVHWGQVLSDEPYRYRMAYLSAPSLEEIGWRPPADDPCQPSPLAPVIVPSALSRTFGAAHRALSNDPGDARATSAFLHQAGQLLSASRAPAAPPIASADRAVVERARHMLAAHLGRQLLLDAVADRCGITPFRLIRVFRRVTGLTPHAYLIVMRVNEARRLLEGGATVSDAVHACGFSDQSHLTRHFRRALGIPPGLYLRAARAVQLHGVATA